MHELSLMESVIDMVRESALSNHIVKVTRIKLVVGKMSMALPDSLRFAFDVLKSTDDLLQAAVLEIEEQDVVGRCRQCQTEFAVGSGYRLVCPGCGSMSVEIISGRQLYVDNYEGEEEDGTG